MRTVIVCSLFFCLTLCVTLLPVFGSESHDPDTELSVTPATYLVLIIPSIAALNAVFVFLLYYAPLRSLFYSVEHSLQHKLLPTRNNSATTVAMPPQSKMIDTDGSRHSADDGLSELMNTCVDKVQLRDMENVSSSCHKLLKQIDTLLLDREELQIIKSKTQQGDDKATAAVVESDHSPK